MRFASREGSGGNGEVTSPSATGTVQWPDKPQPEIVLKTRS